MIWLWEKPLLIVILGLVTSGILAALWIQTGRKRVLQAFLVALAVTGAMLITERVIQTDREQVESTLRRIANDVERNDLQAVLQHVHPSAQWIRRQAEAEFPQYNFRQVSIKPNLEITVSPDLSPPEAIARFNVVVTFSDREGFLNNGRVPRFAVVTFRKDGEAWRVAGYEHHRPTQGLSRRK